MAARNCLPVFRETSALPTLMHLVFIGGKVDGPFPARYLVTARTASGSSQIILLYGYFRGGEGIGSCGYSFTYPTWPKTPTSNAILHQPSLPPAPGISNKTDKGKGLGPGAKFHADSKTVSWKSVAYGGIPDLNPPAQSKTAQSYLEGAG